MSLGKCSQAFPIFAAILCIMLNADRRTKMGETWERALTKAFPTSSLTQNIVIRNLKCADSV